MGVAAATPIHAQPVADLYRGKTLRMLIGYGPGGGCDIYGRLVAEFLPRYLPGNPTKDHPLLQPQKAHIARGT
jgi:tripartite-type tricarboxylate transporter receptor subunit TctC